MPVSSADEDAQILEYNIKNGLGAKKSNAKIYYKIVDTGYGISPTQSSKIVVTYTGKLLNNTTFDQIITPKTFTLSEVIEGWQLGLPLAKKGGRIILIIPSVYAYGCNGNSNLNVPANSVLYYDISLVDVVN